ncbi:MAG: hypothetical protein EOM22_15430, partial [Gammaproteobacteria bacterium]|nr:hypothetical protein [Gammaproteobacteria bacterium]
MGHFTPARDVMKVKAYRPQIFITVYRNGAPIEWFSPRVKENYKTVWNFAELLGDGFNVIVQKSVRSSAGIFTITLPDNPSSNTGDTIYAKLAPMDYIELRMAHEPSLPRENLPLVMRGFVSSIERHNAIGPDGRPNNSVVIKGGDFGKLAEQYIINYIPELLTKQTMLSTYALYFLYGIGQNVMDMPTFYAELVERILNPYVDSILVLQSGSGTDLGIRVIPDIAQTDGAVFTPGIATYIGSLWNLMVTHADTAWHELYFEDREDAPYLVYRPTPLMEFKDSGSGNQLIDWIKQPGWVEPWFVFRDHDKLQSMSSYRSDTNVSNVFIPQSPQFAKILGKAGTPAVLASQSEWMDQREYQHCHKDLYSEKLMQPTLHQVWAGHPVSIHSIPADQIGAYATSA